MNSSAIMLTNMQNCPQQHYIFSTSMPNNQHIFENIQAQFMNYKHNLKKYKTNTNKISKQSSMRKWYFKISIAMNLCGVYYMQSLYVKQSFNSLNHRTPPKSIVDLGFATICSILLLAVCYLYVNIMCAVQGLPVKTVYIIKLRSDGFQ